MLDGRGNISHFEQNFFPGMVTMLELHQQHSPAYDMCKVCNNKACQAVAAAMSQSASAARSFSLLSYQE